MFQSLKAKNNIIAINEENPTLLELKQFAYQLIHQFDISEGTKSDYLYGLNLFFKFLGQNEFNVFTNNFTSIALFHRLPQITLRFINQRRIEGLHCWITMNIRQKVLFSS